MHSFFTLEWYACDQRQKANLFVGVSCRSLPYGKLQLPMTVKLAGGSHYGTSLCTCLVAPGPVFG